MLSGLDQSPMDQAKFPTSNRVTDKSSYNYI